MSTAKRPRQRQSDTRPVASTHPAKKPRLSATPSGLGALIDEAGRGRKTVNASLTNGVKNTSNNHVAEDKAAVASQLQAEHGIDMEDEPTHSVAAADSDSEDDKEDSKLLTSGDMNLSNGSRAVEQTLPSDHDQTALITASDAPSFGDMLLAKYPATIDVPSTLADQSRHATALVPADNSRNLQPPPATSLGTVLTQALKTSDNELLESCLQMNDIASIRSTIQRLQSPLIAKLMLKLAERIHKRPGRAGLLMRWIQWSLVAHGGYLASQPELVNRLRALFQVVRERANSLQPLLMLKGKLDLLSAQVELRRDLRRPQPLRNQDDDYENIDANNDVVYVEGQDESSSSDDDAPDAVPRQSRKSRDIPDDDDIKLNDIHDSEESESDIEGADNLIDDEAIESDDEDASEISSEEEEEDDEDSMDDDEDAIDNADEVEPPTSKKGAPLRRESLATKRPSKSSLSSKRR